MQFYYQMNKNNFVINFIIISSVLMLIFVFLDNMAEAVHKPAGIEELQGRIHWNTFTIFLCVLHNAMNFYALLFPS